jgi:hypothetical protein
MKTIPKFPKYSMSADGCEVLNTETGKLITISTDVKGYKWVSLLINGKIKRVAIHRLIGFTYLPAPDADQIWINHKDGNKGNNNADNLEWSTISSNIKHAYDTGLHQIKRGIDHWRAGVAVNVNTRQLMSARKTGTNHPKFKGWYIHAGIQYTSLNDAMMKLVFPRAMWLNGQKVM